MKYMSLIGYNELDVDLDWLLSTTYFTYALFVCGELLMEIQINFF